MNPSNFFKALLAIVLLFTVSACSAYSNQENGKTKAMTDTIKSTITNPLWEEDFADPHVLRIDKGWYAYATGNPGYYNIGVAFSTDFTDWSTVQEALPDRPSWQPIVQGLTWAPDVSKVGDRYLMLYVARQESSGLQCHDSGGGPRG